MKLRKELKLRKKTFFSCFPIFPTIFDKFWSGFDFKIKMLVKFYGHPKKYYQHFKINPNIRKGQIRSSEQVLNEMNTTKRKNKYILLKNKNN